MKLTVDHTWDTTEVRLALEKQVGKNGYIAQCLERISASWKDVRLCAVLSRGCRRPRVMYPRVDLGEVTLNDLLL